ncbi:aspartate-semialdehyde dehydrogenase [Desulfoluna limicola]|uniref:aspartate-semialdehyde dehydrogenase n=2 Tax=Desulfoluna limicola TaxID=2810562 RepID=A0ABM7PKQ3_9BACT|nr:aspartate-semialdehyde dehydrogenase [Desulfoluna limicola]
MRKEGDFKGIDPVFFTTSQAGQAGPDIGKEIPVLQDGFDIDILQGMDIVLTCQGSDYTKKVHPKLRDTGWKGVWIDAASALRMADTSIIVLDPVNRQVIDKGFDAGIRDFIGGNCTVSLMLMALGGLFDAGQVEWITSMTYQAASGAGAKNMKELVSQMGAINDAAQPILDGPVAAVDTAVVETMRGAAFPTDNFGAPLAGSLIPWIDVPMENGQTREEWKGVAETNKILENETPIPIDGTCVRIGTMRCHSQAITVKLKDDLDVAEVERLIASANDWVKVVPNTKEETLKDLTPTAVTGTLTVPVGRIRKLNLGPGYITLFTVGDQLLWGAAEPVRRMLNIAVEKLSA